MTRLCMAFVLATLAGPALGLCAGIDQRATLTDSERSELETAIAAAPFTDGNHWRAERDGEVLHLVGTMHLDDPRLSGPVARLTPVLQDAAVLLLEITKAEEAKLQAEIASNPEMLTLRDTTLPELMDDATWTTLSAAVSERGLPPFMAAKFQPWYLSMFLALPSCMENITDAANGFDAQLQSLAADFDVPTRALEPYDTVFQLFQQVPLDEQVEMLSTALTAPDTSEDLLATLLAAYFDETHYESWMSSRILSRRDAPLPPEAMDAAFDRMEAMLLTKRNLAWVPVIEEALAETDGPVVAAFGAGHLGGETGVLQLLADAGFTLTRQPF